MKQHIRKFVATLLLAFTFVTAGIAQGPGAPGIPPGPGIAPGPGAPGMQGPPAKPAVPVKVQVVISRFEGDKKVSSLPYTLSVTANERSGSNLRMGSQIPVPSKEGAGFTYQNVGTNIDCTVSSADEARFTVFVTINDSSVMERRAVDPPTLRNFTTSNLVLLRDGQSAQFTAASDKTTGEVVKVDVTLTVEK